MLHRLEVGQRGMPGKARGAVQAWRGPAGRWEGPERGASQGIRRYTGWRWVNEGCRSRQGVLCML